MIEIDIEARAGAFRLDAKFTARAPGIACVFGPSGSGKTTLLRLIAGLAAPARGRIAVGGAALTGEGVFVAPEQRRIGYVFQDSRLFPHLSVRDNLLYGFKRAGPEAGGRKLMLNDVVAALGIGPLLERAPRALSGGERQRVALGRALLAQPRLILMDEPLAGVDAARKSEVLALIRAVQARFAAAIIYVSHDLDETAALADDLILLDRGGVIASGPAAALFADPAIAALADRADARTILDLPLLAREAGVGLSAYGTAGAKLLAPAAGGEGGARFQIFARDVTLALSPAAEISVRNQIPATIAALRARPDGQELVALETPLGPMLSIVTQDATAALSLAPGRAVIALVKAVAIR
jgi:molybdate transport system ATP-binding protein